MKEQTLYEQLEISEERAQFLENALVEPLLYAASIGKRNIAETVSEISKNQDLNENEKILVVTVFCINFQTLAIQLLNPGCRIP